MPTRRRNFSDPIGSDVDNHNDLSNLPGASFGPRIRKRMTYEYDPIPRPYPVCSTSIQCKLLEKESSLMNFQDFRLLDFLQSPLFLPSSNSLSSVSRSKNGKTNLEKGIHPLLSSCLSSDALTCFSSEGLYWVLSRQMHRWRPGIQTTRFPSFLR